MKRILISLLFISLSQANSLSGIIYSSSEGSPIEGAILFGIYTANNETIVVTGVSDSDGNYWIPCEGSMNLQIAHTDYDTLETALEVNGDVLQDFYLDDRENALWIKNNNTPEQFYLYANYPNPFNPITTLSYDLHQDGMVNITIYDMNGNVVNNLVSSQQRAGYKSIQWNATNSTGQPVSAGLYLYTIEAGQFRQTKKMVLLK